MKTLIVYYSLEGSTDYVAQKVANATGADLLRLVPVKTYNTTGMKKFLWGGASALMHEEPELEPYSVDVSSYDRIIIGFPVWASTFAPPIRTFVKRHKDALAGKPLFAFACQGGNGAAKAFSKLAKLAGIDSFEQTAVFVDPKGNGGVNKDDEIAEFISRLQ